MAPNALILPGWIEEVKGIDFSLEKSLLTDLEGWALENGWAVSRGEGLPESMRRRTDVLLERPGGDHVRVAILQKMRSNRGFVRLDASTIRTIELEYVPKGKRWRVLIGAIPVEDDIRNMGWQRLIDLLFKE